MLKILTAQRLIVAGLAVAGLALLTANDNAQARPQYFKAFVKKYPKVTQAKKIKCNTCHVGKKKKNRNDYGMALKKGFGDKKKVKDPKIINEVLTKTEKVKKKNGKTFGSLLKEGKLPGTNPK